ncbi:MAG: hypothetical protein EHM38_01550 [Geobacteraceae bacterium]|nr:MAG: hypothetical protein EHM38_01550 [Geobacteraceae bacterium]
MNSPGYIKKIESKKRHSITCKGIIAAMLVSLITTAMTMGELEAKTGGNACVPEPKGKLDLILAIEKASYIDTIIPAKARSCPVTNRVYFTRDLEEALKIRSPNIGQRIDSSLITDKWDRIAGEVFNCASYDEFIELKLNNSTFFGQALLKISDAMIEILYKVEEDLIDSQGPEYKAPFANSTLREKSGMHGWGMAIDFDVGINPYVLNEKSEEKLDKDLIGAYDNIAKFMLGKNESDLRKLKSGRSAFGDGSIGDIHDILQEESDAMRKYFSLMKDDTAFQEFIETEWAVKNPDNKIPDIERIKAQMEKDYIILGGKADTGNVWRTEVNEDRPFAPNSMRGKGDPATGFLNLRKEFVEAMTDRGFAWGAIDISGEPGDIQHFDLRLQGVGARVYNLLLKYK